jgi:hypothetical protein
MLSPSVSVSRAALLRQGLAPLPLIVACPQPRHDLGHLLWFAGGAIEAERLIVDWAAQFQRLLTFVGGRGYRPKSCARNTGREAGSQS